MALKNQFKQKSTVTLAAAVEGTAFTMGVSGYNLLTIYAKNTGSNPVTALDLEGRNQDGDWVNVPSHYYDVGITTLTTLAASATSYALVHVAGYHQIRLKLTSTLGTTLQVLVTASDNHFPMDSGAAPSWNQQVVGNVAADAADSGNPVKVGGVYNASAPSYDDGDRGDLQISAAGVLYVGGNVADNGADAGNPVKVGGVYNATLPTYADGDRGDLQLDDSGRAVIVGADRTNNLIDVEEQSPEVSAYSDIVTHLNAITADSTSDDYTMVANGYGKGNVQAYFAATAADTGTIYVIARVSTDIATYATIDSATIGDTGAFTTETIFSIAEPYDRIAYKWDASTDNEIAVTVKGRYRGGA